MIADPRQWEALLDEAIREVAGLALPPDTRFFEAGVTSAAVVAVHDRLRARSGCDIPVAAFFRHPTRRSLAASLAGQGAPRPVAADVAARYAGAGWTADARRDLRARLRRGRTA